MQFEKGLWRRFGQNGRTGVLADPERIELIDAATLRAEITTASLGVHRANDKERSVRLVQQAFMQRELARRTGDAAALANAARAAERALKLAVDARLRIAARLELAAIGILAADLYGDDEAAEAARGRIATLEFDEKLDQAERLTLLGLKARLCAHRALAENDLNAAVDSAALFDQAVEAADERMRESGEGRIQAAVLRLHRADLLIGFGLRLKEAGLLQQAEADLNQLSMRIDPVRLPITWCRASALRGAALCGLGDLEAASERIAAGVNALTAAVEHLPSEHSPLDSARIAQKLGHALMTLSVALDDERLCDTSIASFDQALQLFEGAANIAERSICAFDRASAIAAQAERRGDVSSLNYAERVFKQELAAVDARRDPVAWAVMQVALARVYAARADLLGDAKERSNAMLALSEALDLFTERGMRSLADAALTALDQMKASV
jgi:hypothetical protein